MPNWFKWNVNKYRERGPSKCQMDGKRTTNGTNRIIVEQVNSQQQGESINGEQMNTDSQQDTTT